MNSGNLPDRIRKVAIYGRVSTEHEAQLSAMTNQKQWFDAIVIQHPNWTVIDSYYMATEAMRENPQLKYRIRVLEVELNKQISSDNQSINVAVEKATQPLREQLQAKDKDIAVLKATISNLQQKLQDVTQTAAALISAIKYVRVPLLFLR